MSSSTTINSSPTLSTSLPPSISATSITEAMVESSKSFIFTPPLNLNTSTGWKPSNGNEGGGGISKNVLAVILTISGVVLFWVGAMIYWVLSIRRIRRAKNQAIQSPEGRRQTWVDSSNLPSPPISPLANSFNFSAGLKQNRVHNTKLIFGLNNHHNNMAGGSDSIDSSNNRHSITSTIIGSEGSPRSILIIPSPMLRDEDNEGGSEEEKFT